MYDANNELDVNAEMQDLHRQIILLKEKLYEAQGLNVNLLRIMKERANAERHISPKEQRSGYLVLQSLQWKQKYTLEIPFEQWKSQNPKANLKLYRKYETRVADAWQTIIQTPYDSSLPLVQIEDVIWSDLKTQKILSSMGFRQRCSSSENGNYRIWENKDGSPMNGIYSWSLCANFKDGFWTLKLYHTLPIAVPKAYRK